MRRTVLLALTVGLASLSATPAWAGQRFHPGDHYAHGHACAAAEPGFARCEAQFVAGPDGKPLASASLPGGYTPADLQSAYALPGGGSGTVAIVDAYHDPYAASDLSTYRAQFGLAPCTTKNGCFHQVNQSGGTRYPTSNGGWAQEISLDLDMVSAVCPGCHILLVEASSVSFANLSAAVRYAKSVPGVVAVSNSYGGSEFSTETSYNSIYSSSPTQAVTVSSGDSGYGVQFPAAAPGVTAAGGTTLTRASGTARGWSESAWSGAGSGCSAYEPKPAYQTDTGCANRTVADVSAVADPNTGVDVYDSYRYQGMSGWMVFGGTSVASPILASVYALSGNGDVSRPYANSSLLNDVTSGSNGSCSVAYLCTAGPGFDGPTGLGTPNGLGAF